MDQTVFSGATICILVMALIGSVVNAALSWTTLNSSDVCDGSGYQYIYAIGITAIVMLCIYFILLLVSICTCFMDQEVLTLILNGGSIFLIVLVGMSLNLVYFIWGIVNLANQECIGTLYHEMTIVFVVLSGIGILGSFSSNKSNN